MVEIITLASEPAPKQLTARRACQSLGEHFAAFMAANNISGWKTDDRVLDDNNIIDRLFSISATTGMYPAQLKSHGHKLHKLSKASGTALSMGFWLNAAAKCLGYPTYETAYTCRRKNRFIENLWPEGAILTDGNFSDDMPEQHSKRKVVLRMLDNYRINRSESIQRNRLLKLLEEMAPTSKPAQGRLKSMRDAKKSLHKKDLAMPIYYRIN